MTRLYHGTNKENAESILKEGFQPYTYFAQNMADSVYMGGPYVFSVFFDQEFHPDAWQPRFDRVIPPEDIIDLVHMPTTLLHWNPEAGARLKNWHFLKDHPDWTLCEPCGGRGQMEQYPPFFPRNERSCTACEACEACEGFGSPEALAVHKARKFPPITAEQRAAMDVAVAEEAARAAKA